jgi:hypothetical protein
MSTTEIPNDHFKAFTLKSGREVRVWGNEVIEARTDAGEWRIVNEKVTPAFASSILSHLIDHWDEIPVTAREPQ